MEPLTLGTAIGWALTTLGGAFGGSWLGAYMKKKGEDRAMKEGFKDVLEQTRETTAATKSIEAKISDDVWDRQKRWEMRRDVVSETAKSVAKTKDALQKMHGIFMTEKRSSLQGKPERPEKKAEAYKAFNESFDELEFAILMARASCGRELGGALNQFGELVRDMSVEIGDGKPEVYLEKKDEFAEKYVQVGRAMRAELGFEKQT